MGNRIIRQALIAAALWATAAADAIPIGALQHDGPATPEQLSLILPVTGSLPNTATATVRYRPAGSPGWTDAHPMFRIRPDHTSTSGQPAGVTVTDDFAWPIIDLSPGTSYEVEATVSSGSETETRSDTFTTRSLPVACAEATTTISAGSTAAQIASVLQDASPGDVIEFEDGTYNLGGDIRLNGGGINGTAGNEVCIRGESREGTVLQSTSGRVLYIVNSSSHVIFENMTFRGSGRDAGVGRGSPPKLVHFFDPAPAAAHSFWTFRNMTFSGANQGIKGAGTMASFLVYDNTFNGTNEWMQDFYRRGGSGAPGRGDGTPDVAQNLFWNDDGINLPGLGHAVWNNTIRGFGDSLSYCSHSGKNAQAECRNIHFYRNDVYESGDDCAELDYAFRNVTMYDNRCTNAMTAASLDNAYGGPFLIARNVFTNVGRSAYKFNGTVSGMFVYNNTLTITDTKDKHGWIQFNNGALRSWGYRNNIFVYLNAEGSTYINEATGHDPIDFTHNSWFPDSRNWAWNKSGGSYGGLSAAARKLPATTPVFSGQARRHFKDNRLKRQPYAQPLELGKSYLVEFEGSPLPILSKDSRASGNGTPIANITDGFSGSAPDRGALIKGRTNTAYGDRSKSAPPP